MAGPLLTTTSGGRMRPSQLWELVRRLAATAGDPSLSARAQALLGLLLGYGGDFRTAVATLATAADLVEHAAADGNARRRFRGNLHGIGRGVSPPTR